jgi:hypothetical protein
MLRKAGDNNIPRSFFVQQCSNIQEGTFHPPPPKAEMILYTNSAAHKPKNRKNAVSLYWVLINKLKDIFTYAR